MAASADVVRSKAAAGRPKDLVTLATLRQWLNARKGATLDDLRSGVLQVLKERQRPHVTDQGTGRVGRPIQRRQGPPVRLLALAGGHRRTPCPAGATIGRPPFCHALRRDAEHEPTVERGRRGCCHLATMLGPRAPQARQGELTQR